MNRRAICSKQQRLSSKRAMWGFRPSRGSRCASCKEMNRKLKKGINDAELANIALVENPDVLATLGNAKTDQIVVGFAAETNDVIDNARKKLIKKNADMIVANEVDANKVFGEDDDEVWLVTSEEETHLPLMSKAELADIILDTIAAMSVSTHD